MAVGTAVVAASPDEGRDVVQLLARIGARVEQYFARAQSIICRETVHLQPLSSDLTFDGSHVRKLVYELRVAWEATEGKAPEATVLRELVSIDGRPPKQGDEPGCMDPKAVSPEPLAMLLAAQQPEFAFTWAGAGRTRWGPSVALDFKSKSRKKPEVTWKGECVSVDLPGRWRGKVWIDSATGDVVRLDEQMIGIFEIPIPKDGLRRVDSSALVIERADSSIRYRPVLFHDPEETVMLPESIVTVQVVRNSGVPRLRITQSFTDYRRFITDGRIVSGPQ